MLSILNESAIDDVMLDRRTNPRRKTNSVANIAINNSHVCRCVIKDISLSGAKLAIPEHSWVPDNFKMQCPDGEYSLDVVKVWSNNGQIGVKFKV